MGKLEYDIVLSLEGTGIIVRSIFCPTKKFCEAYCQDKLLLIFVIDWSTFVANFLSLYSW